MQLTKAEEISADSIGGAVGQILYRLPPNTHKFMRLFED